MSKSNSQADTQAELAELKRRSAELIAEAARINERIDALAKDAKKRTGKPTVDPSIMDTWQGP